MSEIVFTVLGILVFLCGAIFVSLFTGDLFTAVCVVMVIIEGATIGLDMRYVYEGEE